MKTHYRSNIDKYTPRHPSHAALDKVYRPKSMKIVNSVSELNRLKTQLEAAEAKLARIGELPKKWLLDIASGTECRHRLQAILKGDK